jgi:YesN/AraC family two-component response regulator
MTAKEILKKYTILYVEDDKVVNEELSFFLKKIVGTVYTAFNGKEGLIAYKKYKPDVVLTDIKMPIMSGLEMAKNIKDIDNDVPIIVTTAYDEQEYLLNSVDIGIDEYVLKPINPLTLLDSIINSLNTLKQKKELIHKNIHPVI